MPRKCEGAGIIFKTSLTSCFLQESSKQKLPVAILFPGVALLVILKLCISPPRTQRLYRLMHGHGINELSYIFTSGYINLEIYLFTCPSMHLFTYPCIYLYAFPAILIPIPISTLRLPGQGSQYVKMLAEAMTGTSHTKTATVKTARLNPLSEKPIRMRRIFLTE